MGNIINNNEIYPNKNLAKSIADKLKPTTLQEFQVWLGAANYLRKYIVDYAEVVQPLYNMMKLKNIPKHLRKRNDAPNKKS